MKRDTPDGRVPTAVLESSLTDADALAVGPGGIRPVPRTHITFLAACAASSLVRVTRFGTLGDFGQSGFDHGKADVVLMEADRGEPPRIAVHAIDLHLHPLASDTWRERHLDLQAIRPAGECRACERLGRTSVAHSHVNRDHGPGSLPMGAHPARAQYPVTRAVAAISCMPVLATI